MARQKEPINPFYLLVVVVGMVFLITAFGYGAMSYRAIAPRGGQAPAAHPLMAFLDANGMQMMAVELVLLGAATCGAMWLDRFRSQRDQRQRGAEGFDDDRS